MHAYSAHFSAIQHRGSTIHSCLKTPFETSGSSSLPVPAYIDLVTSSHLTSAKLLWFLRATKALPSTLGQVALRFVAATCLHRTAQGATTSGVGDPSRYFPNSSGSIYSESSDGTSICNLEPGTPIEKGSSSAPLGGAESPVLMGLYVHSRLFNHVHSHTLTAEAVKAL